MNYLRIGSKGKEVKKWQYFLIGQGFFKNNVTGIFDINLDIATKEFQRKHKLTQDGIVGNFTMGKAMLLGYGVLTDTVEDIYGDRFPKKPKFSPIITNTQKQQLFGELKFKASPLPNNPEHIIITNNWDNDNIIKVSIPQLIGIKGNDIVYFHKKGEKQLKQLWNEWEKNKLLHHVLTWEGSYNPRFVRGSRTSLSNHSFGTAFDINYKWNKLGVVPAFVGNLGSVRELVEIANNNGFYWGGHFSRRDGMHFEIALIK